MPFEALATKRKFFCLELVQPPHSLFLVLLLFFVGDWWQLMPIALQSGKTVLSYIPCWPNARRSCQAEVALVNRARKRTNVTRQESTTLANSL